LYVFCQPHTYSYYGFVCWHNLYELVSSLFGNNIRTRIYLRKILRLRMVTSYKLVYFRLSTIRILPNKLVHHVTVRIHSSPPAAPAAATTAHNAGAATVATGGYITRCSQRITEENEVDRRSRYVFLNLYDFFYTICRILICMVFLTTYVLVIWIRMSVQLIRTCIILFGNNIQTRIYLCEILRLCMGTSYELIYFCLSTIRIPPNKLVHHVTV
jgi:hypothetical protein